MILEINFESDEPIYMQLRNRIIEGIAQKKILPGESLPSVRQMAAELGINLHTVNKVYNLLKKDGFIVIHKRKGVLVNSLEKMQDPGFTDELENTLQPFIAEAICRGIKKDKIQEICENIYTTIKGEMLCLETQ